MKRSPRAVIVHGSYGSPDENWFPWLASELRKIDCRVVVPKLPTPEGQSLQRWRDAFAVGVGPLNSDTILIGHSLGAGFILNLLEDSPTPVRGTFLVSGFLDKLGLDAFDRINESFVCRTFAWDHIRGNAGVVHVYNSDDDPYVPLEKGRELAKHFNIELTVLHNAGHVNAKAGFTTFPQLLKDIEAVVQGSTSR
jgi:hypothetical protein